jgi:hypothetical protein
MSKITSYNSLDFSPEQLEGDNLWNLKHNTIIGEHFDQQDNEAALRSMLMKGLNIPGATPMNTEMNDEK